MTAVSFRARSKDQEYSYNIEPEVHSWAGGKLMRYISEPLGRRPSCVWGVLAIALSEVLGH